MRKGKEAEGGGAAGEDGGVGNAGPGQERGVERDRPSSGTPGPCRGADGAAKGLCTGRANAGEQLLGPWALGLLAVRLVLLRCLPGPGLARRGGTMVQGRAGPWLSWGGAVACGGPRAEMHKDALPLEGDPRPLTSVSSSPPLRLTGRHPRDPNP